VGCGRGRAIEHRCGADHRARPSCRSLSEAPDRRQAARSRAFTRSLTRGPHAVGGGGLGAVDAHPARLHAPVVPVLLEHLLGSHPCEGENHIVRAWCGARRCASAVACGTVSGLKGSLRSFATLSRPTIQHPRFWTRGRRDWCAAHHAAHRREITSPTLFSCGGPARCGRQNRDRGLPGWRRRPLAPGSRRRPMRGAAAHRRLRRTPRW